MKYSLSRDIYRERECQNERPVGDALTPASPISMLHCGAVVVAPIDA
jgi:hypothetical protein